MPRRDERAAVERVMGRAYKHHLQTTGRLPSGTWQQMMRKKIEHAAKRAEGRRK